MHETATQQLNSRSAGTERAGLAERQTLVVGAEPTSAFTVLQPLVVVMQFK